MGVFYEIVRGQESIFCSLPLNNYNPESIWDKLKIIIQNGTVRNIKYFWSLRGRVILELD